MYLFHDSRQPDYRSPFGAVPVGTRITLHLDIRDLTPIRVFVRLWTDRETLIPMEPVSAERYGAAFDAPAEPGLLWYYFQIETSEGTVFYAHPLGSNAGTGAVTEAPESWQVTVYQPTELPEWYRRSVVYQIFPDRFARGDDWERCQRSAAHPDGWKGTRRMVMQNWHDTPFYCKDEKQRVIRWPFFGGNLSGIRHRLPYLKSMGIGAIYLNPIFLASSNHKYDTADYLTIDPGFGTEEDFSALCRDAKAMGIRIILDGVFSHTGDDSLYFNRFGNYPAPGAASPEPSPYDGWYRFGADNECGYECWWGVDSLPNVEETEPTYQSFICGRDGVIRKWLRLGASGWRLDVADELPDSFIAAIRAAGKAERDDALLLGEVWEDASHKISYGQLRPYLLGSELDCTMHYPFRVGAIDFLLGRSTAFDFAGDMDTIRENYPAPALYGALNLIGTHDTPRILTLLGEAEPPESETEREHFRLSPHQRDLALRRLRLLDVLLFTFPGVPCVYYGDEAGMEGFSDPFNRGTFPWGQADGGLQYFVRMLSHLRREYPVFVDGDVSFLAPNAAVFGLRRSLDDCTALIYVNPSRDEHTISLPRAFSDSLDLLTGLSHHGSVLELAPLSAVILYRQGSGRHFSPLAASAQTPTGRGILCPLFSLPGGECGTMAMAPAFLSALKAAGFSSWMLLPLCPVGDGNSPYSSRELFAMDPRYLDPNASDDRSGFETFCEENAFWLEDYAIYTILRRKYDRPWQEWPKTSRDRKNLSHLRRQHQREIQEIMLQQYRCDLQWERIHALAKEMGISLIGDLPIYAALDSADTWAHRELFQLDELGYPTLRAGCPPDYFTPEGQDWGNPLYRWEDMAGDGYLWWKRRLKQAFRRFDYVRLDHFRGFAAYYAIPADSTAMDGYWMKGPGLDFFRAMAAAFGRLPIIAEDLGTLDNEVTVLLRQTGFSGMNVWQFTPEEMAAMSPQEASHRVFFSGTHDNQTLRGYLASTGLSLSAETLLRELDASPAASVIFPVQDILGLGDEARINVPGVPKGNWHWQLTEEQLTRLAGQTVLPRRRN